MSLKTSFQSFAHAIAAGSKYFATVLIPDALKIASKAQVVAPEVDALVGILAGPQAASLADTALHVFGQVAAALKPVADDQLAAVAANGVNLKLDLAVAQDIKIFTNMIEQLLKARGTPAPTV